MKRHRAWAILGALLLLTVAIYSRIWKALPLSWDDGSNIFGNPYYTMHMWWGVWTEPYYGLYVPVTGTIWAFLYWLGGGDAWPFHALNIFLHAANVALVYFLSRALARRLKFDSPDILAAAGAALFAFHPLQIEAVAWISGGRDLLATFFALTAVAVYYARPSWLGFTGATALFALGLLSKPSIVTVPLAVLGLDFVLDRRSNARMAVWLALSAGAAWLTHWAQVEHFTDHVVWWHRPLLIADTYRFYLQKLAFPAPLSGNYGRTPESVLDDSLSLSTSVLVTAIAGLAVWMWRGRFGARAVLIWAVLLLPVSGLVPFGYQQVSGVADHYAYMPMAAMALGWMAALRLWPRIAPALAFILALGWASATWFRLPVWSSDLTFFSDMAMNAPDSYNTAIGMSVVMCEDTKQYDDGLRWVDKALALRTNDIVALANRAFCLIRAGRMNDAAAMDYYLDMIDYNELAETQPTALSSLLASIGTAYFDEQRYEDGYQLLCEAFRVKPSEPSHARNLAAAGEILKKNGLTPACDQPVPPDDPGILEDLLQPRDADD